MAVPTVEVIFWPDCPSWPQALEQTRAAMAEAGLDPAGLRAREIRDEDEARAAGFPGSPTILVDGSDVAPVDPALPGGLTCRLYRRRDGHASPLPDGDDMREALRAAAGLGSA